MEKKKLKKVTIQILGQEFNLKIQKIVHKEEKRKRQEMLRGNLQRNAAYSRIIGF